MFKGTGGNERVLEKGQEPCTIRRGGGSSTGLSMGWSWQEQPFCLCGVERRRLRFWRGFTAGRRPPRYKRTPAHYQTPFRRERFTRYHFSPGEAQRRTHQPCRHAGVLGTRENAPSRSGRVILSTYSEEQSVLLSYKVGRRWRIRRDWGRVVITRPVWLRSLHSIHGIGLVKWHGIPMRSFDVVVVGNARRWDQTPRESVVPVWLIYIFAFSFSESRRLM